MFKSVEVRTVELPLTHICQFSRIIQESPEYGTILLLSHRSHQIFRIKPLHIPSLYEKKNSVFSWELVFVCPCPPSFSQGLCNEIPAKISS